MESSLCKVLCAKYLVWKVLYFAEPLTGRSSAEVLPALEKIVNQANLIFKANVVSQVVYRMHSDKAPELAGPRAKEWGRSRGIVVTSTAGYDPNSNGRAERAIGLLKERTRHVEMLPKQTGRKRLSRHVLTDRLHVTLPLLPFRILRSLPLGRLKRWGTTRLDGGIRRFLETIELSDVYWWILTERGAALCQKYSDETFTKNLSLMKDPIYFSPTRVLTGAKSGSQCSKFSEAEPGSVWNKIFKKHMMENESCIGKEKA